MIIWLALLLVITFFTTGYLAYQKSKKANNYQILAMSLLAFISATVVAAFVQYEPALNAPDFKEHHGLSFTTGSKQPTRSTQITVTENATASGSSSETGELAWEKISKYAYDLMEPDVFVQTKSSPFLSYRSKFVNKTDKIIVGIEFEIIARKCGHGAARQNCPIENEPITDIRTNIIIQPNQMLSIGSYVPISEEARNYEMEVAVKHVAYFNGDKHGPKPLIASTDYNAK